MIHRVEFFVPGLPKAKQYRQTKTGVVYAKGDVKRWEQNVSQCAQVAAGPGWKPVFGAVYLELWFYFPIPKTRKELVNYDYHLQDPDLTNLLKATEDGLKKILFPDDCLVWKADILKRWCIAGKEGAKVHVVIEDEYTANKSDPTKDVAGVPGVAPDSVPAKKGKR